MAKGWTKRFGNWASEKGVSKNARQHIALAATTGGVGNVVKLWQDNEKSKRAATKKGANQNKKIATNNQTAADAIANDALGKGIAANEPYNQFGGDRLGELAGLIKDPGSFRNNPEYIAALKESNAAIEGSAAANGTLLSGGTLKDVGANTSNVFDQKYSQYLAQLAGFAQFGERAIGRNENLRGVNAANLIDNGRFATGIRTGANTTIGNANAGYYGDQNQAIEDLAAAAINGGTTIASAAAGAPKKVA